MYVYKMLPVDDENAPALRPGYSPSTANAAYTPPIPAVVPSGIPSGRIAGSQILRPASSPAGDNACGPGPGNGPPSSLQDYGCPGAENRAGRWSGQNPMRYCAAARWPGPSADGAWNRRGRSGGTTGAGARSPSEAPHCHSGYTE